MSRSLDTDAAAPEELDAGCVVVGGWVVVEACVVVVLFAPGLEDPFGALVDGGLSTLKFDPVTNTTSGCGPSGAEPTSMVPFP